MKKEQNNNISAPVIGISRFRVGRDGNGITTLVAFQGCPLRCKYCINPDCWKPADKFKHYTPKELYDELKKDDLYFRSTEGGVTFGGGEPALRADFIAEFRKICGPDWKIRIETSLNVDRSLIDTLAPVIDEWIIDTKAESSYEYKRYTGQNRQPFMDNVSHLTSKERLNIHQEKLTFKVPVIPEYVDEIRAIQSVAMFKSRFPKSNIELVTYLDNEQLNVHREKARSIKGKELCNLLTIIRHDLSDRYGLNIPERECTHTGDCQGTCPLCDYDLEHIGIELNSKNIDRPIVSSRIKDLIDNSDNLIQFLNKDIVLTTPGIIVDPEDYKEPEGKFFPPDEDLNILEGDVTPPEDYPPLEGQVAMPHDYHEYQKIVFKECALAGVSFHLKKGDDLWFELDEGVELALVRDKNNKHDSNAVAVALADDYDGDPDDFDFDFILGYVPRTANAELAAMLDAGYGDKLSAKITTFKEYGNINDRIRITIYLETSEPVLVRPDLLRAHDIDIHEIRSIMYALQTEGTFYARFGGFPLKDKILPTVGEKIVFIHEQPNNYVLLLMRVIAEDEDCRRFTKSEINCIDDQLPFILSNIIGPISLRKSQCRFLSNIEIKDFDAVNYLTEELSDDFETLFKVYLSNKVYCDNADADPSIDKK